MYRRGRPNYFIENSPPAKFVSNLRARDTTERATIGRRRGVVIQDRRKTTERVRLCVAVSGDRFPGARTVVKWVAITTSKCAAGTPPISDNPINNVGHAVFKYTRYAPGHLR